MIPQKLRWSAPQRRLVAAIAKAPAAVLQEATDRAHHLASPAQYRNPCLIRGVETRHPANEFADRILPRQSSRPHSDFPLRSPAPAAALQSAKARRRNPAEVRRLRPAVRRECCAQ